MKLPKSFNEVTIGQFQECYFILKADPTLIGWSLVISILSGWKLQAVESLPLDKIKQIKRTLLFLLDDERLNNKVKKYIAVNGHIYKSIYEANKLSTSQAIDIKTFMKPKDGDTQKDTVVENAHNLLASIYLPLKGFKFKYNGANHAKIASDFKQAKMGDVYGTLFFYSLVWEKWTRATQDYGQPAMELIAEHMEEVNQWASKNNIGTTGDGK